MKSVYAFLIYLLAMTACDDDTFPMANRCGAPGVAVYPTPSYDGLFSSQSGNLGAGEINSSIDAGSTKFWFISNGLLNTGQGEPTLLRNCILVQNGSTSEVKYKTNNGKAQSFLPEPDNQHYYSLNQGKLNGSNLEIIASRWKITGSGRFDFVHESSLVIAVSLSDWTVTTMREIPAPADIMFGAATLDEEGYTYIYATKNVFWNKDALIARVSGSWFNAWQYFDGYQWQASAGTMRAVLSNVSDYFSVFKDGDRYCALSFGALFSQEVSLWQAYLPAEGWSVSKVLYCPGSEEEGLVGINAVVNDYSTESLHCSISFTPADLTSTSSTAPRFISINEWR